jgi:hypothetical protein
MNRLAPIATFSKSRQRWLAAALSLTLSPAVWAGDPAPLRDTLAPDTSDTAFLAVNDPTLPRVVWDFDLTRTVLPDARLRPNNDEVAAPAQELAEGLSVQITQSRRKFRARAVSWLTDRSVPAGMLGDLLLGGAETGWHVVASPGGHGEYILEWKTRFH